MLAKIEESVLKDYRRYLHRYALQQVRDPDLANDLVQDTFLAALEGGCRFEGRSAIRTWLVGILKHKIADSFRYRGRAPLSLEALGDGAGELDGGMEVAENLTGAAPAADNPEAAEARRRFWEACQAHLDRMPAQAARAFMLREVLGHDSDEVCRTLGITDANLWTTLHRTRKRLQHALEAARPA
jgi:RNA polymerase sigma-70 factor (ECF subfamily)